MFVIVIILFVLVSGTLAVLTFENFFTDVQLSVFIWQTPHMPLGLLLLLTFLLGAFLLYIVSVSSALRDGRELKKLRRRVEELQQAVAQMSPGPVSQGVVPPANAPVVPMPSMPHPPPDISDMTTLH